MSAAPLESESPQIEVLIEQHGELTPKSGSAVPSSRARCFPAVDRSTSGDPLGAHATERIRASTARNSGTFMLDGVRDEHAIAIGLLLPAMVCGEESAALVFQNEHRRVDAKLFDESHVMLSQISSEEEVHERLLKSIGEQVPTPGIERELRRSARGYFLRLKSDDIARHFSRIAWLDSGVCTIFGELTRRDSPLVSAPNVQRVFRKILHEEARHTLFSRRYAARMGLNTRSDEESHFLVRAGLVELLKPCAAAFDALEVDPDRLFQRLLNETPGVGASAGQP